MSTTITIDPVSRIEGHLKIEVTIDAVDGLQQVVDAKSSGTMFRGFELLLQGRDPLDAPDITQRICGVCPISHAVASCKALEKAFGISPPANARLLRNLVLGANFIQSHVMHFYHLAVLDYINTDGILNAAPWTPRQSAPDMITGPIAVELVNHYISALDIRRKSHQMGAIFGGKLPSSPSIITGGCSATPTTENINSFRNLLVDILAFTKNFFIPDVMAIANAFPEYYGIGHGCGNLIAYGVFDLEDTEQSSKLFEGGRMDSDGNILTVDPAVINEDTKYSWYTPNCDARNPANGLTEVQPGKANAYSWTKAPRYQNVVHEAGPLARMKINGEYVGGVSVVDRLVVRALETEKVINAMATWLDELEVGGPVYQQHSIPSSATGIGLCEAPRGALGHWISINNSKIASYQVVTPTSWNTSPKDSLEQPGPLEQALIGTPVLDINNPVEVLRVAHSFDPCLACSVHMVRPDSSVSPIRIDL